MKQCWCENRFGKRTHQGHCKLLDLGSRFCASPCGASHRSVTRDASMIPNNSLLMGKMRVGAVAKHLPGRGEVKFILPQGGKGSSGAVWKHTRASSKTSKAFSVTSPCKPLPHQPPSPRGSPSPTENAPRPPVLQITTALDAKKGRFCYFTGLFETAGSSEICKPGLCFHSHTDIQPESLPTMPRLSC